VVLLSLADSIQLVEASLVVCLVDNALVLVFCSVLALAFLDGSLALVLVYELVLALGSLVASFPLVLVFLEPLSSLVVAIRLALVYDLVLVLVF